MENCDSKPAPMQSKSVGKLVSPGHVRSDTTNGTDMHGLGTFDDTPIVLSHGSNHQKPSTDAFGMVPVNGDWSVGLKMGGSTDEPLVSGLEYNNGPVDVGNPTGLVGEAVATVGLGLHPNNHKRRYDRNRSKRVHAKRQAMKKKKWIEK